MADVLADTPLALGLCPKHQQRFYVPIHPGGSTRCPMCDEPMKLYTRASGSELREAVNRRLRQAAWMAVERAKLTSRGWTFVPTPYVDQLRAALEDE